MTDHFYERMKGLKGPESAQQAKYTYCIWSAKKMCSTDCAGYDLFKYISHLQYDEIVCQGPARKGGWYPVSSQYYCIFVLEEGGGLPWHGPWNSRYSDIQTIYETALTS
jgi:hypothetical protein